MNQLALTVLILLLQSLDDKEVKDVVSTFNQFKLQLFGDPGPMQGYAALHAFKLGIKISYFAWQEVKEDLIDLRLFPDFKLIFKLV